MTEDDKRRVAAAYRAATRAGDAEAMAALCEPDAVTWHNHDDTEVDVERSARTLRWLHRTAPGGPLRAHTCTVVTLPASGRVVRTEEYLDSAALAPLTG